MTPTKHPARYTDTILPVIASMLEPGMWVLDPFAGVGGIHQLQDNNMVDDLTTIGAEIEPEWAANHRRTFNMDVLDLWFERHTFDAIATSPTYGNRMADHHNPRDGSRRVSYKFSLGRDLHPHNSGQLQWGPKYRAFHEAAWKACDRVLKPGGRFILNCSDHIRGGQLQQVTGWHLAALEALGYTQVRSETVFTPRMRHGANRDARVGAETVTLLVKP